ncbi:MAG: hypothetical protein HY560_11450, partial [Gemmatimonadetes bacterium]|nr:hypothetical protein [Gemmatimonadota bacterium]
MTQRRSLPSPIRHPTALLVAAFALSCLGDTAGPGLGRPAHFQIVPSFQSSAPSGIVPIDRIRIVLFRPGSTTPALDTLVQVAPGDTIVNLTLTVTVLTQADSFSANLALITPQGDTAFRGGPLTVVGKPSGGTGSTPQPVTVPITYTGTGAGADSVVITGAPPGVLTGDTAVFLAVAYDNDAPLPGTPIGWTSLDPSRATVPNPALGRVVGGSQRGPARIVATLLTGPADTAAVTVSLFPTAIVAASGGGQTAVVGSLLPQPLVAQVTASDNVGVEGVWVRFAVISGGGSLGADSALTDAEGSASVQWTLGLLAGTQQVRATTARLPDAEALFTATALAGVPATVAVHEGNNQTATVGTAVAVRPSVVVKDVHNNVVPGVTVNFTAAPGSGVVEGATQTTDALGIARVGSWTLGTTAGINTLTAASATTSAAPRNGRDAGGPRGPAAAAPAPAALTATFTATGFAGAVAALGVTGFPTTLVAGTLDTIRVTARDQYGNVVPGYRGTVQFSSTDPLAVLPGSYTFVEADNGVHDFAGVTLKTAGSQSVTATDAAAATVTGGQSLTVTPAGAASLVLSELPETLVAGVASDVTVTAKDPYGNTATGYRGTIHFTSSDLLAVLPPDYQFVEADAGAHTFTAGVTLSTSGSQTVTATDISVTTLTSTQTVTVSAGSATSLVFTVQPTDAGAGTVIAPEIQVTARDAFGNTALTSTGNVTVAIKANPSAGTLSGTTTAAAVAGVAKFSDLSIDQYGSDYTLTGAASGLTGTTSTAFTVTPVGMTARWTGAAGANWSDVNNWSPAEVPGVESNVFVPAPPSNQPVLSEAVAVNDLIIENGAELDVGAHSVTVKGNLSAGNTIIGTTGTVQLTGTSKSVSGTMPRVQISGSYTAGGPVQVNGNLTVTGTGSNLTLGGRTVTVTGTFGTESGGTLTMTNGADLLDVTGAMTFAGGNTGGLLTAGVIRARGDFTQVGFVDTSCPNPGSDVVETFKASGTHRIDFIGNASQQVTFNTPGAPLAPPSAALKSEASCPAYEGGSQVGHARIDNAAGITVGGALLAAGDVTVLNGAVGGERIRISVVGSFSTPSDLTTDVLEVGGALTVSGGTYNVGTTALVGGDQSVPSLPYQSLDLAGTGTATLLAATTATGGVVVRNSTKLALNAQRLTVSGGFLVRDNATLQMSQGTDLLQISGSGTFQGPSTDGLLTAGTIELAGTFTGNAGFKATGSHKVTLNGGGPTGQSVSMTLPGAQFWNLDVTNPGGMYLFTGVAVAGNLSATVVTDSARGQSLDIAGTLAVSGSYSVGTTIFSGISQVIPLNLPYQSLVVNGTASIAGNLSISGSLTVGPGGQLDIGVSTLSVGGNVAAGNTIVGTGTVQMIGSGTTLQGTLSNLELLGAADVALAGLAHVTGNVTLTKGRLRVNANRLTVDGNLAFSPLFPDVVSLDFGAPDTKPSAIQVAGAFDADGTNFISMHEANDSLIVSGDATFFGTMPADTALKGGVIVFGGGFDEDGSPGFRADTTGNNKVVIVGAGGGTGITFYLASDYLRHFEVADTGYARMGYSSTTIWGDLSVTGSGVFEILTTGTVVGGNLTTSGSGILRQQGPYDLTVKGNVTFGGGSTDGQVTAGTLVVKGNFAQSGDPKSFAPSGTHTVRLDGTGPSAQTVSFSNPGAVASHFRRLELNRLTASPLVQLTSDVHVEQKLEVLGQSELVSSGSTRILAKDSVRLHTGASVHPFIFEWSGSTPNSFTVDSSTVQLFQP